MRIRTSLPVAFLSIGILATAACSEQGADVTAPEKAALEAPSAASFQQQNVVQGTFGNLIAALNNITAQIIALNNLDVDVGDITVVDIDNLDLTVQQVRILNNVLNNNQVDIDALQNFLNNNTVDVDIRNVLNNLNIEDVVAIDVLSGDVIIFTR